MNWRGLLISFADPAYAILPTGFVAFQYNPTEITRILKVQPGLDKACGLRVSDPPVESYAMKVELDALEVSAGHDITRTLGVAPLLASLEAMMEPGRGALAELAGAVVSVFGGEPAPTCVPSPSLPLVVLVWSAERFLPVRIDGFTARETSFDAGLQPVHATVDLSLTVLRASDLEESMKLARILASAYQLVRTAMATVGIFQSLELLK